MNALYRIQYRESENERFVDDDRWSSSQQCIHRMRSLFSENPRLDFRIVDESGLLIASTANPSSEALGLFPQKSAAR